MFFPFFSVRCQLILSDVSITPFIKYIHALKCSTGSGDVDTSKVVKADADGAIVGASGW